MPKIKLKKTVQASLFVFLVLFIVYQLGSYGLKWYLFRHDKPYEVLLCDANAAIANIGDESVYDTLAAETDFLLQKLSQLKSDKKEDELWFYPSDEDWEKDAPTIFLLIKELEKRAPNGVSGFSWVNSYLNDDLYDMIPKHVCIRFGTHSSYAWMHIFTKGDSLQNPPDYYNAVHIGGTVFLTSGNL